MSSTPRVVQVVEDRQPELGALLLLPPQPEDLALALERDADREVAGAGLDASGPRRILTISASKYTIG